MNDSANSTTSLDDIHLASSVGASAQSSIQHADSKAGALASGHICIAVLVVNEAEPVPMEGHIGAVTTGLLLALATVFVIGTLIAGWHLGRCLTPRLEGPLGYNRFALPNLAASAVVPTDVPIGRQREEAWAAAVTLARIAMRKHRAISASLVWITISAGAAVIWLYWSIAFATL